MSNSQQAYISKVHLKGYKSIRDLEIDFKPGLNIIIGPNGSGKTNFVKILSELLSFNISLFEQKNFESSLEFAYNQDIYKWQFSFSKFLKKPINSIIYKNGELIKNSFGNSFYSKHDGYHIEYLQNLPKNLFKNTLILFGIERLSGNEMRFEKKGEKYQIQFRNTLTLFFNAFISQIEDNTQQINNDILTKAFKVDKKLIEELKKVTVIEDIRVSPVFKITEQDEDILISYIRLEFLVNNQWLSDNQLSSGTNRLLYLMSNMNVNNSIVFIEEPELGIHPDQLYKLMDFIKEQSKERQIIITTHSPEVLSILNKDEIDRIIVTRYDAEKGTQMHHLSVEKTRKAQIYIEETGDLSSFWVHSNLEEYDAEETEN
jgi:predicted ATP-dependent endonuclease of OLD family